MFLITGFPRSGTRYLATLLNAAGLDVGHEEIRPDGVVSWAHVASGHLSWTGEIEPHDYDPIIHVTRDPLKVISSAQTLRDESLNFIFSKVGFPDANKRSLKALMFAWLKWNEIIEGWAEWRFKVEGLPDCYPTLFEKVGLQGISQLPDIPKNINTRPHSDFTWTDLKRADKKLYKKIREKAKKYGYEVNPPATVRELPKVSAIMMMKNEAHNLRRCLDSIRWVDEICIVDTGSTDNSMDIAREYGAKIMESPWQNDFSFHRNQSVSLADAPGDSWLLQIDCDEALFMDDPVRFKTFLSSLGNNINGVAFRMDDIIQGQAPMSFNPVRCFRSGKVKYEKAVHNEAIFEGAAPLYPDAHFNHYGYDLTAEQWKVKHERTIPLLMKRLEENPEDKKAHFHLANSLTGAGRIDEAIEHAEKYLASKNGSGDFQDGVYYSLIQLYLKKDEVKKACGILDQAMRIIPDDLDIAFIETEIGVMMKNKDIIMHGALRYLRNYDNLKNNPAALGNRFCYNNTPEKNIYCSTQALALFLANANSVINRIETELGNVPEDFAAKAKADLKKLNVTIGVN